MKMNILLLSMVLVSANSHADPPGVDSQKDCEAQLKTEREKPSWPKQNGNNSRLDAGGGSDAMQSCVELSKGYMRNLFKSGQRASVKYTWTELMRASDVCAKDALKDCNENKTSTTVAAALDKCSKGESEKGKELKEQASRCDAAAFIISTFERDWTSPEHVKTETVKGGNPLITCVGSGIETVDYEACVKFVQNGDIMDAAQTAVYAGQELYYKDKTMTAQANAAQSTESGTAGLEALKTGVKGQQDMMTQRAALDTGKFAALVTYYSEIPDYEAVKAKCTTYSVNTLPGGKELGIDNKCDFTAREQGPQVGFAFLKNQPAKEKMKAKLAKVGIDVASDAMMAGLMAKRVGDISNAIAKVEAFKPIDPLAPAADNLQTTYCQQNPGDAKCLTGGLERTFDAMGDNVITFGDGGTGTSYANKNPALDGTTGTTNAVDTTARTPVTGAGSVISAAQQKGGLADTAAKASVGKGTAPTAGGGGGGSGGGLGGGGGGGAAAQQAGGASAAIQGKAPTYGGGTGTLSMMGGLGINRAKSTAKDDGNPFGKLFNKDANKSGALDFGRSPASQKVGNKGDNLFEMISKRYSNVNTEKRLIEYEMTK